MPEYPNRNRPVARAPPECRRKSEAKTITLSWEDIRDHIVRKGGRHMNKDEHGGRRQESEERRRTRKGVDGQVIGRQ